MAKIIKLYNNTSSEGIWAGQTIGSFQYYQIQPGEVIKFSNDAKVFMDIGDGTLLVNDGSDNFADPIKGWNYLSGNLPTRVSQEQNARYRLNSMTPNVSLPKLNLPTQDWTTVYVYEGSGYLYSFWVDVNANKVDLEVEFDGNDVIVPAINLDDVSGFGGSGQATMMPLVQLGSSNFAFTPQEKIRFETKIEIKMATNATASGTKKLTKGYVSLVKET